MSEYAKNLIKQQRRESTRVHSIQRDALQGTSYVEEERADLVHDFERVQHVGLSKVAEWVCKDAIGNRINEISEVLKDGKDCND